MKPFYADDLVTLHHGESEHVLPTLPDASVDSIVTDPPYELGFMGRAWDASGIAYNVDLWREAFRVLKPGGHLLAFGGTRTVHRLTCAIEDAGFEIRDGIDWLYASGFPKSLDVSKAIDKAAGAERELTRPGRVEYGGLGEDWAVGPHSSQRPRRDNPATDDARRWQGWGTALKPAREPIVVARKPLAGTVAANVLQYGTGALNIDACRVAMGAEYDPSRVQRQRSATAGMNGLGQSGFSAEHEQPTYNAAGRWPSNVVLSHAPDCGETCLPGCPVAELDAQSGTSKSASGPQTYTRAETTAWRERGGSFTPGRQWSAEGYGDSGGASRFFPVFRYQAKAPTRERPKVDGIAHPTVKPLALMRWLVRLVTPAAGTVLDPFAGSGTTAEASVLEGFHCIAIEREAAYLPLITTRLAKRIQPALDLPAAS